MRTIEDEIYGGIPVYVGDSASQDRTVLAAAVVGFLAGRKLVAGAAGPAATPSSPPTPTMDGDTAAALMRVRLGPAHKPLPAAPSSRNSTLAERMEAMSRGRKIGARYQALTGSRK